MIGRLKFDLDGLANEMLDRLPLSLFTSNSTTFLDPCMGGGQFVKAIEDRLLAHGHSNENISQRVFGVESNQLRVSYTTNKHRLVGKYVVHENYLEYNEQMRFDCVIGNPPYQDVIDSGKSLWPLFVEKSMTMLKEGGKLCFVTPSSWVGKKSKGRKSSYTTFNDNYLEYLAMFDSKKKNEFFPGVGTTICWFILSNENKAERSTVVCQYSNDKVYEQIIDIEEDKEYPISFTPESISIHTKITAKRPFKFVCTRELHYHTMKRNDTVSEIENERYPYKSHFSHRITRYSSFAMKDYKYWKVMVPKTATIKDSFVDRFCNVSEDLLYIICDTKKDAITAENIFKTKLYRYIGFMYRKGRNMSGFSVLPEVDLTRNWTDAELYEHFGLTQEEIDYIEENVK